MRRGWLESSKQARETPPIGRASVLEMQKYTCLLILLRRARLSSARGSHLLTVRQKVWLKAVSSWEVRGLSQGPFKCI